MKVLFFCISPEMGASSRFRVYNYVERLERAGVRCHLSPPYGNRLHRLFTLNPSRPVVAFKLALTMLNRLAALWRVRGSDVVFIQRELLEIFPNRLERLVAALNPRLVFDFDDALHREFRRKPRGLLARLVDPDKTEANIRLARVVIAGNEYLADYARAFNPEVFVVPTPVDLDRLPRPREHRPGPVTVGWIGGGGNLVYLDLLAEVFRDLQREHALTFRVVCDREYRAPGVRVDNKTWRLEEEAEALLGFDIGIMPLPDNEYTRGKCGFKILQYMAAGLPVVCSPTGVNQDIVVDGVTGFVARDPAAWREKLAALIRDVDLRRRMGAAGRKLVAERYDREVVFPAFLEALRAAAVRRPRGAGTSVPAAGGPGAAPPR